MEQNSETLNQIELKGFYSYFIAYFKNPVLFIREFKYFSNRFVIIFLIILYGNFGFRFYSYISNTILILLAGFLDGAIRYVIGVTFDVIGLRLSGVKKEFDIEIVKKVFLLYSPLFTVPYSLMIFINNLINDSPYVIGKSPIDLWTTPFFLLWAGYSYYILKSHVYERSNKYIFNFWFIALPVILMIFPFVK